ncbi:MAG: SufS family cysteine desulfurase, partial [Nanoarchaeota archaeon]
AKKIKKDFPIFERKINGKELVYLDTSATSQHPGVVIDKVKEFYERYNSNIHRGMYTLSEEATDLYEKTREKIAKFINADKEEIIFTKNATEAINYAVFGYFAKILKKNDVLLLTEMEHNSNVVPWKLLSKKNGFKIGYLNLDDSRIDLRELDERLKSKKIKVLAITHASNVLGTINPIKEISKICRKYGTKLFVDGAQAAPHLSIDVKDLGCDFYAFSGHKMLGPLGVGILYVRKEFLKYLTPFISGGGTVLEVTKETLKFKEDHEKFEGGTPNVADVVAFGSAIDYLNKLGMNNIRKYEEELTKYALSELNKIKDISIYNNHLSNRLGVIAFNLKGIHAHDVASVLNEDGICVRASHHCSMILHKKLGINGSVRVSIYVYNTKEDIDKLIKGILKVQKVFGK